MGELEKRNLEVVKLWAETYNNDVDRMVNECYRIGRTHAAGDVVVVEATLFDPDQGDEWRSPFCAILTFKDGCIVEDRTYLDDTRWPGFQQPK